MTGGRIVDELGPGGSVALACLNRALQTEELASERAEIEQLKCAVVSLWAGAAEHDLDPEMTLFVGGIVAEAMERDRVLRKGKKP